MNNMMWPRESASIRAYDKNSKYCMNIKLDEDVASVFLNFADCFFNAAEKIIDNILGTEYIGRLDCDFFSFAYLYRHSLELELKAVAFKNISNKVKQKKFINDTRHNLSIILDSISCYVEKDNIYYWLKSFLDDMSPLDKESDAFRYPFKIIKNTDGFYEIKKFFNDQRDIDLNVFKKKMVQAFNIIKSYYNGIDYTDKFVEYNAEILEDGGEEDYKSVIGYKNYFNDFYGMMVQGYLECGEYLADLIIDNPSLKKIYFFPMCYLFRNTLELELKQILFEKCSYSFQEKCRKINCAKHSFLKLWNAVHPDIVYYSKDEEDKKTVNYVDRYIEQLHGFDSSSSVFRYPTNKDMNYHFKNNKYIDAKNIAIFFKEVSNFFRGVMTAIDYYNECSI